LSQSLRQKMNDDDRFGISGAKIGTVLNVRKPPRYIGRTGATMIIEDSTESSVPIVLNTQFGVDISFTSLELGLSIDDFSKRFIQPAVAVIANKIDDEWLALSHQVPNVVGTPGTPPTTLMTYLDAGVMLDDNMAPRDNNRTIATSPRAQANIVDALTTMLQ